MMVDSVNVIRNNRYLLKKPKFKDIKRLVIEFSGKTELEFKQVSAKELARIKESIRKEAKKTKQREIAIYGTCALMLFLPVIFFLIYLFQ